MDTNFMRLSRYFFLLIFLGLSGGSDPMAAAESSSPACPVIFVDIDAGSSTDRGLVCDGAVKAVEFFQSHGIEIKRPVFIRLHKTGIKNHPSHIGVYGAMTDHIDLLTLQHAEFQTTEQRPFGMQMNEPLYVSFAVHEVAHAIADQNFNSRPTSLIAPEYLAYVAQLATMEPRSQEEILQRYRLEPFASLEKISSIYYELNPCAFGVKVFRHYQSLAEQSLFIQELLSGVIKPRDQHVDWY